MTVAISRQVAASADDVRCVRDASDGHTFANNVAIFGAGYQSSTILKMGSAARFTDVQIPRKAIITKARLKLRARSTFTNDSVKSYLWCHAHDDSPQIANDTALHALTPSATKVAWDDIEDWTAGTDYYSANNSLITAVQAVVDRPGWNPGQAITVAWEDWDGRSTANANTYRSARTYDADTGGTYAPILEIEYHCLTEVKAGVFAKRSGTGTQQITGLGFTPKLLLLFAVAKTADGFAAGFQWGFGASDGVTSRAMSGWSWDDHHGADTDRYEAAKAIAITQTGGTTATAEADLDTFDADGFTLDWTTNDTSAWIIHYLAIGGEDVECDVTSFDALNNTVHQQAYTHVGFKPDLLLLFGAPVGVLGTGQLNQCLGFADGSGNQFAMSGASVYPASTMDTARYQRTNKCFVSLPPAFAEAPDHVEAEASLVSMDTLGFTLDWTTAAASTQTIVSVAIRGIQAKVGAFNAPGATGDVGYTGAGFLPRGALFAGFNTPASTSIQAHNRFSLGVADTPRNVNSIFLADEDNVTPHSSTNQATYDHYCHLSADYPDPVATYLAALVKTWDADGFTLTWDGISPFATDQVGYLLLGDYEAGAVLWGEAALAASGTMAAAGLRVRRAAAVLSGAANLTAAGRLIAKANATLAGTGTMAAVGKRVSFAAASLGGAGTMIAAGRLIAKATAALSASSTMTAAGRLIAKANATLAGTGTMAAVGKRLSFAAAALAGSGTMTAAGRLIAQGAAVLSTMGTLSAAGWLTAKGVAVLSATGTMAAAGWLIAKGQAALSAVGSLSAVAFGATTTWGAAALSGSSNMVANGRLLAKGATSLSAAGDLTFRVGVEVSRYGVATLSGSGLLAAVGKFVAAGKAVLSASGGMVAAASGGVIVWGAAVLSGATSLVAAGRRIAKGSATLSGAGTMAAAGLRVRRAAAVLSGAGTMIGLGIRVRLGTATLAGSGTMTATARRLCFAAVSLVGTGTLTAVAHAVYFGRATFQAIGTLVATAVGAEPTVIKLRASDENIVQLRASDEPLIDLEASYG